MILSLLLASAILVLAYWKFFRKSQNPWTKQNVHCVDTGKLASTWERITQKVSLPEFDALVYRATGDRKYCGYMDFGTPVFFLKDLDLVKHVMIKDFDYFVNRQELSLREDEKIFNRMLSNATGNEWKALRTLMSPTFSTGKIRRMFEGFKSSGENLVRHLEEKRSQGSGVVELQDAFGRYTLGTIGLLAFGQPTDTYDEVSTFRQMAKRITNPPVFALIKVFFVIFVPRIAKLLRLSVIDSTSMDFFSKINNQNISQRRAEKSGIERNDFLQLLLEAQAENQTVHKPKGLDLGKDQSELGLTATGNNLLDDETILAQSILFFIAGSDTTESGITFLAYHLAMEEDIQEKLAKEIKVALAINNGQLTYEALNEMHYLDACLSESLRLHPPAPATLRTANKDYPVPGTDIVLPKGTRVAIPIRQIHHDPQYFTEPLKFNPDNFSQENKAKRSPYAFLTFGQGPRNCIGMRFALIKAKIAITYLISNYKILPTDKTPKELNDSKGAGLTTVKIKEGLWLELKIRDETVI